MCGVMGTIGLEVSREAADLALARLGHRGPDAQGQTRFPLNGVPCWLGHTRLSILDLTEAGAQPMRSRCGRWIVSFNGEIYNHLALRNELPGRWRGHSDTETLVEAIAAWGVERTAARLNGIFAFAAFDVVANKAYLVRDPFGVKPLYYQQAAGVFVFASEVRGIAALCGQSRQVDREALQTWLTLRFVPSPDTLFAGVKRLRPGHILCIDAPSLAITESAYIRPQAQTFEGTLQQAADAFGVQLQAAIQRQLLSDVPVGLLLSGGIDSALIAAGAKSAGVELPTYTVGFGDSSPECELNDARDTARWLGLENHAVSVTPDEFWETLPLVCAAIEEPLGTTSVLPMWHLIKRARQDVTVVLTGQGSDEPWGGYRRYQLEILRASFPLLSRLRHLGTSFLGRNVPEHVTRALRSLGNEDIVARFIAAYELFAPDQREALSGRLDPGGAPAALRNWIDWLGTTASAPAMQMMHIDSRLGLADDLLLYGDKVSMAFSQEARVPFLDPELMAFVESLPLAYRVRLRNTKIALREAAKKILPAALINRPKKGFQVPFGHWVRCAWRTRIEELLLAPNSPHLAVMDRSAIARILALHTSQGKDMSRQLFALVTLAIWWRQNDIELKDTV
jgi:asparagine synthase (glutamine-hydrolysing)